MSQQPKILLLDIETAPNLAYIWGLYQELTTMDMIEREWYILCWRAKWLNEKKIFGSALIDFPKEYKKNPENDYHILLPLWKMLDEADIVITHNGVGFDLKKINSRFLVHGMKPPSPYKTVDTLIIARNKFGFTSNKLGDLCKTLGIGSKKETGGFNLWRQCMQGIRTAWNKMIKYCSWDVVLLEKVYLKILPFIDNHPNVGVYLDGNDPKCPNCGCDKLQKRGFGFSSLYKYQRLMCTRCGAWSRLRVNLFDKNKIKVISK